MHFHTDTETTTTEQRSDLAHSAPEPGPLAFPQSAQQSDRANTTPEAGAALSQTWLSATFLHKHESREAFEALVSRHVNAHAPATPQEELLTFRIAQRSWILRRYDTLDRVIADSAVTRVRLQYPNAAPAACIATTYLEVNETEETRFYDRITKLRREQEANLDRLESKLQTLQQRRRTREDRQRRSASEFFTPSPQHPSSFANGPTRRLAGGAR